MSECTCGVGSCVGIVHEGDCPARCTFWRRDYHSDGIAQCDRLAGHTDRHRLNLYRGSPSARRERGVEPGVPEPNCSDAAPVESGPCPYYYLDPDNPCTLPRGHREIHKVKP